MNPYDRMVANLVLEAEEGIVTDDDDAVISFLSDGESEMIDEDDKFDEFYYEDEKEDM